MDGKTREALNIEHWNNEVHTFCLNFSRISFFFPLRFPCTSLRVKKWGRSDKGG